MSDYDDINTAKIATFGFLGVVLTVATVLALVVIYHHAAADQRQVKEIDPPWVEVADLLAAQRTRLAACEQLKSGGQDAEGGAWEPVFIIPIERAMELVVEEEERGNVVEN